VKADVSDEFPQGKRDGEIGAEVEAASSVPVGDQVGGRAHAGAQQPAEDEV